MSDNPSTLLLDDVLFRFRQESSGPTPAAVADWRTRFPRFADEIAEEAILWAEEEMNAKLHRTTERDERLYAVVKSAALNSLYNARIERETTTRQVTTLAEAMEAVGTDVSEMSRQMSLPRSVVSHLVRGDIMGASIPQTLTEMVSRLIRQSVEWISARYPATLVAAYGDDCDNRSRHQRTATMTFQDAVMNAPETDDAQRKFWLEEA